jgi:predicted dehydrogenase
MHGVSFEPRQVVRLGMIGTGGRGQGLLKEVLACNGADDVHVEITALADISPLSLEQAVQRVRQAGHREPATFSSTSGWQKLLELDLDIVYIATPWDSHAAYAAAAMQTGKHVAVEVPAATTLEECWQLVETSESTRRHCVMLENCCYDYWETLVKRMVDAGLLGTVVHAECAYIHDLRSMLLEDTSEGLWRRESQMTRNGNLYPTHGLGPVAQCLGIGDEDRFETLVSMSSRAAGMADYTARFTPESSPKRSEQYICGDMNTSLIRTKLGRTIVLQHSTVLPRPYDRNFLISGTKGTFRDYPPRLYIDGEGAAEEWLPLEPYRQQWEDPLWQRLGELARQRGGHGGMDFIMNYRLLQTLCEGQPPDSDVYDAADWSAPGPLSELSVVGGAPKSGAGAPKSGAGAPKSGAGSQPQAFPNFRRA